MRTRRRFRISLSRCLACHVHRHGLRLTKRKRRTDRLERITGPALLGSHRLIASLGRFSHHHSRKLDCHSATRHFLVGRGRNKSFHRFGRSLFRCVVTSISPACNRQRFGNVLRSRLFAAFTSDSGGPISSFLQIQAYDGLFGFLIMSPDTNGRRCIFLSLVGGMKPLGAAKVLLQVLLVYRGIGPFLSQHFSVLFGRCRATSDSTMS